jgi:ferredoxin
LSRHPFSRLIRPSTRAWIREARRTPGYSLFDWIHGYVYARWPYLYIGTGEHPLARIVQPLFAFIARLLPAPKPGHGPAIGFADTYHGKVVPPAAARQLVTVNQDVRLLNLEKVIPYALARDIVMHDPDHIAVLECPCRASRPHPCLPLDVCLIVGEPFAGFILEHQTKRARRITQGEAVAILAAEHDRGHVAHAFFKDAMLGRFYAICNCCACCCGAMQAQRQGTPMLTSSGYVSVVDTARCASCGACADVCQFTAITVNDGHSVVDAAACMGCGVCVSHCPHGALSLVAAPDRGAPLELAVLMEQAAAAGAAVI